MSLLISLLIGAFNPALINNSDIAIALSDLLLSGSPIILFAFAPYGPIGAWPVGRT